MPWSIHGAADVAVVDIVAVNAVLLKRVERDLGKPGAGERTPLLQPARAA
jgi:hypothetical protein